MDEERLGCSNEIVLADCDGLFSGDKVELTSVGSCNVVQDGMRASTKLLLGLPLDVNRVTLDDLQLLPGIGERTAQAILDERDLHGPFKSVADLKRVRGIGQRTIEKLDSYLIVHREPPTAQDW